MVTVTKLTTLARAARLLITAYAAHHLLQVKQLAHRGLQSASSKEDKARCHLSLARACHASGEITDALRGYTQVCVTAACADGHNALKLMATACCSGLAVMYPLYISACTLSNVQQSFNDAWTLQAYALDSSLTVAKLGLAQVDLLKGETTNAMTLLEDTLQEAPGWLDALKVLRDYQAHDMRQSARPIRLLSHCLCIIS